MNIDEKYKFYTDENINDIINIIKNNTDNKTIDLFFGTNVFISKTQNNNVILIARTFNSFKKNFYCSLKEENDGVLISGEFKFSLFMKMFFSLTLVFILLTTIYTLSSFSNIKSLIDKIMFISVLIFLLLIELLIYSRKNNFGMREKKMILNFINETLKAVKII